MGASFCFHMENDWSPSALGLRSTWHILSSLSLPSTPKDLFWPSPCPLGGVEQELTQRPKQKTISTWCWCQESCVGQMVGVPSSLLKPIWWVLDQIQCHMAWHGSLSEWERHIHPFDAETTYKLFFERKVVRPLTLKKFFYMKELIYISTKIILGRVDLGCVGLCSVSSLNINRDPIRESKASKPFWFSSFS